MNKSFFKSIAAVLAGMVMIILLSTLTDMILETLEIFPPIGEGLFIPWMLILALAYRCIYAVAGGYITARLAPSQPIRHAIILGIIGIVLSIIGTIVGWDKSAHWYPIALVATSLPCTWYGGKWYVSTA